MEMTTQHLDMSGLDVTAKLRDLIKDIHIAMLTTWDGHHLRSRPMASLSVQPDGDLWFFTKEDSEKAQEIDECDHVNVAYARPGDHRYVSVSGRAVVLRDLEMARELWTSAAKVWFTGPEDPTLVLVRVTVEGAEFWDSDGKMKRLFGLMRTAIMGHPYPPGTDVEMSVSKAHLKNNERRI
jgi:general stress protein 26